MYRLLFFALPFLCEQSGREIFLFVIPFLRSACSLLFAGLCGSSERCYEWLPRYVRKSGLSHLRDAKIMIISEESKKKRTFLKVRNFRRLPGVVRHVVTQSPNWSIQIYIYFRETQKNRRNILILPLIESKIKNPKPYDRNSKLHVLSSGRESNPRLMCIRHLP